MEVHKGDKDPLVPEESSESELESMDEESDDDEDVVASTIKRATKAHKLHAESQSLTMVGSTSGKATVSMDFSARLDTEIEEFFSKIDPRTEIEMWKAALSSIKGVDDNGKAGCYLDAFFVAKHLDVFSWWNDVGQKKFPIIVLRRTLRNSRQKSLFFQHSSFHLVRRS